MNGEQLIGLGVAIILALYLGYVLLRPERF
ncbi:MAG: potassium-transporting ATPase subunit F [Chloroflexi bacterium]|nr:potassium-transporting ATPase subunit F [Chloroflexota bacterium]GIW12148.1 MAG: hypothetical protein KatS3mg061_3205 [Dehalococcoidia bacterium]